MKEKLESLEIGTVLTDIDIKNYSTYKVSAKVPFLVQPSSIENLQKLIAFLKEEKVKYKVIGACSNLIFTKDYEGVLIRLDSLKEIEMREREVVAESGVSFMQLALKVSSLGFKNFAWGAGLPGTVGGAVFNNAGCYGADMESIIKCVKVLTPEGNIEEWDIKQLQYGYRNSFFKEHSGYIILSATMKLEIGIQAEIDSLIKERREKRKETQPLEYPSAGSVFRNPEGMSAGKMIEDLGLKGKRVGGAEVSQKHANFIINRDNATGMDIKNLIEEVKKEVKSAYGIDLICEQEFVE